MKKRILAALTAGCLAVSLAGCGGAGSSSAAADTGEAAQTPAETETAESPAAGDAAAAGYTIGICQQQPHEALDAATQGFKDALVEAFGEDGITFDEQNAQGDSNTCSTIINGFVSGGYDLIMANGSSALQAAAAGTADIPILGTSVTEYGVALGIDGFDGTVGGNVSGTSDLAPLDQQAQMLADFFPVDQYPTVGMLYCSAEPNSAYQVEQVTNYLTEMGYTVEDYSFSDSNDLATIATNASTSCDVLYIPTDNTAASNTEIIQNICLPAGVPIIAGEQGICSGCGVATLSISYYDLGYATGEMAVKVLTGEADISAMPIEYAPNFTKMYNPGNCEALGITVPDDYVAIEE